MWRALFLLLALCGTSLAVRAAEETEYLALRGGEAGTHFNRLTPAPAPASPEARIAYAGNRGFIQWKNKCVRVSRKAAGDSFEFGGESGFGNVAAYTRRSEPPAPGFMEILMGLDL